MQDSPFHRVEFRSKTIYIKRDDLLHPDFDGNKARKLAYLQDKNLSKYKAIVSYGSNQSNAMYSLSVFCKMKNIKCIYFTKVFSSYLKNNIAGNLKGAIANNIELHEVDDPRQRAKEYEHNDKYLYIPEGVSSEGASEGISVLAQEVFKFIKDQNLNNPKIFSPSGTGATALYLQRHLKFYDVYTTACSGDKRYLFKQFGELENDESLYPTILELDKKYHFGKLYSEFWDIYQELLSTTNIEFDLLYDPLGWMAVIKHLLEYENDLIYIHCGGIRGNETMKARYSHFFAK